MVEHTGVSCVNDTTRHHTQRLHRVIAIDRVPERLRMAETYGRAETINFETEGTYDRLMEMTKGRGPDRCIDFPCLANKGYIPVCEGSPRRAGDFPVMPSTFEGVSGHSLLGHTRYHEQTLKVRHAPD